MSSNEQTVTARAFSRPVSAQMLEAFIGAALVFWLVARVVLVHSLISDSNWAVYNQPYSFAVAVVAGCLLAALAYKGLDFELPGIVGVFCLLFGTLAFWSATGDSRPIVLVLFLVAARDMDLVRLLRFFGIGTLVAIVAAAIAVAIFAALGKLDAPDDQILLIGAFKEPSMLACLLFGALCCVFINARGNSRICVALVIACLFCSVAAFVLLHAKRCGLLMIVLAACVFVDNRFHDSLNAAFAKRSTNWLIAALPIALFCLSNDIFKLYAIGEQTSGFAVAVPSFGYAITACFIVLYIRAILLGSVSDQRFAFSIVFILYAFYLLLEQYPLNLEFNCSLLLLSLGFRRGVFSSPNDSSNPEKEQA